MKTLASKKLCLAAALFFAAASIPSTASAESLLAFINRANNATNTTTHVFAPLDNGGATSLTFKTTGANKVVKVSYNAECGVLGPTGSWQSVTILIDGVQANPTSGTLFAFCTASSTSNYIWTGALRQSTLKVPLAGNHIVQVLIDLNAGATNWWLGDSSIVVEQQ